MNGPELLADSGAAKVYHASWEQLLSVVPECNALIVDAPYSERTHSSHRGGAALAGGRYERSDGRTDLRYERREIDYPKWTSADVSGFVSAWASRVSGWFVSITDHTLAPAWGASLEAAGRYVFAPIVFVAPGSRVRLSGDGPSNWSTWLVVARPRTALFKSWGTLPGAYVLPPGHAERMDVVGSKPLWLMERLVEDYTRPGDLVVDPCCGAGTTLVAAERTGRKAVGGDIMREHAEIAARRVSKMTQRPLFTDGAP